MAGKQILIVDDSFDLTRVLKSALQTLDPQIKVMVTPSAEEAMLEISKGGLDLIISDIRLPGITGLELLKKIRKINQEVNIIMITGLMDTGLEAEARKLGANFFLRKPIEVPLFLDTVGTFLDIDVSAERDKAASVVPAVPIIPKPDGEEPRETNLSEMLHNLFYEVRAEVVLVLDENGKIKARIGDNPYTDFESRWSALILPVLSAAEKLAKAGGDPARPESILTFRFDSRDLILSPLDDYALVVILPSGRGHVNLALVVDSMLYYQKEFFEILKRMGLIKVTVRSIFEDKAVLETPADLAELPEEEDIEEESDLGEFESLFEAAAEIDTDPDSFWETAEQQTSVDLDNPDIISYDQAARLGLAPEDEEE